MQERAEKIEGLRRYLARYELDCGDSRAVPLGHTSADAFLQGIRPSALHEVYAPDPSHCAAASAFAAGLARRLSGGKFLFWIGMDFSFLEHGVPNARGYLEFGIDPRRLIMLRMANAEDALRAASDILACAAVGAFVLEIEGPATLLDLTTSRRLSLAAAQKGVSVILLRLRAQPDASAAETRWLIHHASSPPPPDDRDWGYPMLDTRLLRNRHGDLGEWIMEWNCNSGFFSQPNNSKPAPHSGDLVAAVADGPAAPQGGSQLAL